MKIKELFEKTTNNDTETFQLLKQLQDEAGASSYSLKNLVVLPDGSVNCEATVTIEDLLVDENGELKIKLNKARAIVIKTEKLKSFTNFPQVLEGDRNKDYVIYASNKFPGITSFGDMKASVLKGTVNLAPFPNLSLSGINKHIPLLNGGLSIHPYYKGPLLSVLKIKDIKGLETPAFETEAELSELSRAMTIINFYIESGGNIIACQKELFDNNLDEYAEL